MLMTSGVNFGFRRTLPHLMGVVVGLRSWSRWSASGSTRSSRAFPRCCRRCASSAPPTCCGSPGRSPTPARSRDGEARGAPLGFFGAAAFQWINPKGWVMAVSALTAYAVVDNYARNVAIVALTYFVIGLRQAAESGRCSARRCAARSPIRASRGRSTGRWRRCWRPRSRRVRGVTPPCAGHLLTASG